MIIKPLNALYKADQKIVSIRIKNALKKKSNTFFRLYCSENKIARSFYHFQSFQLIF
jgi:hypothetical protein